MVPIPSRAVRALGFGLLVLAAHSACAQTPTQLENAFPNLTFTDPIEMAYVEDGSNRLYIAEKDGIIRMFDNNRDVASSSVYLDIAARVQNSGERGLLGMAFHPQYPDSAYVYVHYSANDGRMTLSRFTRSTTDTLTADPASEQFLLQISDFASNHNGGKLTFGPDGHLYISFGDGGGGGDPMNYGQNRTVLFGKLLRLDVNHPVPPLNYGIPRDNPYAGGTAGFREEIFAYGLRNMWKFSFNRADSTIWGADVGQNQWEEIDLIHSGDNLGWRIMEGAHCFNPSSGCDQTGLELPIYEYSHSFGCSITGGYVYHGTRNPEFTGEYIYSDYCGGTIWGLTYDGTTATNRTLVEAGFGVIGFGEDPAGEVYVFSSGGPNNSRVRRFVPTNTTAGEPSTPSGAAAPVLRLLGSNPAAGAVRVAFSVPQTARVQLAVYDVLGREVARPFDGTLAAGVLREAALDGARLAPGTYVVRLTTDRGAGAQRTVTLAR